MRVEFHSGVADKVSHACRVLRKAYAAGARVAVCGEPDQLDRLDIALWTFDPLSFVPHVRRRPGTPGPAGAARTPIWLVEDPTAAPDARVLMNLGTAMVPGWEQFDRVVEIVASAPEDSDAGRQRWRRYAANGAAEMVHHPLGSTRE